jgi:probable HAF family extracellular repeat protein
MKSRRTLTCITGMTLFAALTIPVRLAAQQKAASYTVTDLGTLGGTFSIAGGMDNKGQVVGFSTLLGDMQVHAFLWRSGVMNDLRTLGGPNSIALFPLAERGEVAGVSETSTPDPLGEDFCGFGTNLICLPFVWQKDVMTPLPTLGGSNGQAREVNNRGEIAGFGENTTPDPSCEAPQVLHFKPVLWERDEIHELPTIAGDPDGVAVAINDNGQAVGQTGDCTSPFHAVLWQNGTATDLGNLGEFQLAPQDINNQAQVVGFAFSGSTFLAFLWQNNVATDLGTLPGDVTSVAVGINSKGQVVGGSFDIDGNERAFLWQDGVMTDLNTLIPADSPLFLIEASGTINSRGQIAGFALQKSTGEMHAFLATPSKGEADSESATPAARDQTSESPKLILPENVRKLLRQRLGLRYHIPGPMSGTAVISGPTATLSPTSLTFSTQAIGTTSAAKTVTLKNTGTTSLTISSIAITGTNAGDFAQTHTCGSSLAAGASCTFKVTFKPTASGTRSAALSVTDNAAGSPQKVTLNGIGTTAKLSPTSMSFGTVAIGTTSAAKKVTLTNVGSTALSITAIAITGTNAGDFAQTHTCGSSLAAGASCSISVTFKPTASGTRTAALSISDNAAGSPQKVTLSGIGTTAKLSPTSLSFGVVTIGTMSPTQTVTLTNVGTTTLTITGIAITGTNAGDFAQTHTCGSSLAAGASCAISVTFKPTQIGTRTGTLSITDNAPGSPQTVSLSGTGTDVELSPTSLRFACIPEPIGHCTCFVSKTTTLTNVGNTTLNISGITISGPFTQTNTCDASVAAGSSCNINVTWSRTTGGGAVSVSDNGGGSPQMVSLFGNKLCSPFAEQPER